MEMLLKLQVNFFAVATIVILWVMGDRRRSARSNPDTALFRGLLLSTAAMLVLDSAQWFFDGAPGALGRAAVLASASLYFAVHTVPIALFVLYAHFQAYRDEGRSRALSRILIAVAALVALAALASPFTGWIFGADEGNRYRRGSLFPAFALVEFAIVAFIIALVVASHRRLNRRVLVALLCYPLPMLAAGLLQTLHYGLILLWPTSTLFLVVAASTIENRRSKTDYLTGTANRRSLDEELERRIALSKAGRALFGMLIDIDDFKAINDNFGHEAGDQALEDVARILKASVRVDDHVARMGGDEFVILADFREAGAAEDLVRRIERGVRGQNDSKLRPFSLSLSVGRAPFEAAMGDRAADFLALLDANMYARKKTARAPA